MNKPILERISSEFQFKEYHFDCGVEELNHFFYEKAKYFIQEDFSQLYLLRVMESSEILGFFTLSCTNIRSEEKELATIEKIARYIPGLLVGIFAVYKKYQNKGVGTDLMRKAIYLSLNTSLTVGCRCVVVDSHINDPLIKFYQKIGFEFVNKTLGSEILQKLHIGSKIKRYTIKLYLDLQKIRKQVES